jgi:hypothetical protein
MFAPLLTHNNVAIMYKHQYRSAWSQVNSQLETINRFIAAEAVAKSQNHKPEWDCIVGINYLAGFLGCCRSTVRRMMKAGIINGYKVNGAYYFLIYEIIRAINTNEQLFRINWESYEDTENKPDEMIIHWKKWLYSDRVLIKFTFLRRTSTLSLPPETWGKNARIIKRMIREINKRDAVVPFNKLGHE